MPYGVVKRGRKFWTVSKTESGKIKDVKGKHDTLEKAEAQKRALYSNASPKKEAKKKSDECMGLVPFRQWLHESTDCTDYQHDDPFAERNCKLSAIFDAIASISSEDQADILGPIVGKDIDFADDDVDLDDELGNAIYILKNGPDEQIEEVYDDLVARGFILISESIDMDELDRLINEAESTVDVKSMPQRASMTKEQEAQYMDVQKRFLAKMGTTFTPPKTIGNIVSEWSPKFRTLYFNGKIDEINAFLKIPINDLLARIQGWMKLKKLDNDAAQKAAITDLMPSVNEV